MLQRGPVPAVAPRTSRLGAKRSSLRTVLPYSWSKPGNFAPMVAYKGCCYLPHPSFTTPRRKRRKVWQSRKEVSPRTNQDKSLVLLAYHITLLRYNPLRTKPPLV